MTLHTQIFITDPMARQAIAEFFAHGQALLTEFDEDRRTPEQQVHELRRRGRWENGVEHDDPEASWEWSNQIGQGLPAIWDVSFYPERPYRTEADNAAEHDGDCLDPRWTSSCVGPQSHLPPCHVEASLDTAYGYRGAKGESCSQLHAVLIARLGA